jgi:predicted ATPase
MYGYATNVTAGGAIDVPQPFIFLTPLVGRENDLAVVCSLLKSPDVRLLTLTGAGGVGKTRLALEATHELEDIFPEGIFYVTLVSIRDADQVIPAIAQTFRLPKAGGQSLFETLASFLQDRQILLLLDNVEQVVAAAPQLVALLATCRDVKLLVTSRQVLRVQGEYEYVVPPLTLPDIDPLPAPEALQQVASVALFMQRIQGKKHGFQLTNENASSIAEICRRLDGLPLALELAAVRIKLLSPKALLSRLSHRLQVLNQGGPDLPERQQTLRSMLTWSYELLNEEEQMVFRRLSYFVGGCTLEAAEAICASALDLTTPVLDVVTSLLDKSLLQQVEQHGIWQRLYMLETIREYGIECLIANGELEQCQAAHAAYYLAFVEEAEPELIKRQQCMWLDCLQRDIENIRSTLIFLREQGEEEQLLRMVGSLGAFWLRQGHLSEGLDWAEQVIHKGEQNILSPARIKSLLVASVLALFLGQRKPIYTWSQDCLAYFRSVEHAAGFAIASWTMTYLLLTVDNIAAAQAQAEEALAFVQSSANDWAMAVVLHPLGSLALYRGDYSKAQELYEKSIDLFNKVGDLYFRDEVLTTLADLYLAQGNEKKARLLFETANISFKEVIAPWTMGWLLCLLGQITLRRLEVSRARLLLEEGLKHHQSIGDQRGKAQAYALLAQAAALKQDYSSALAMAEQSLHISQSIEDSVALATCLEGLADVMVHEDTAGWAARLWGAAE